MPLDLKAITARLDARMPDPLTPAFQLWRTEQRQDTRDLVAEVRMLRALWSGVQQEGAGRLD